MSRADARSRVASIALTAGIAGCLASCGGSSGGSDTPSGPLAEDATFTYALSDDPGQLDPATNLNQTGSTVFRFAYETMIEIDPDGEVTPALAAKWTVEPKRVSFTLREHVTCADGTPLTASTVAQNFDYLKDPEVQNPALGTLDFTTRADDASGTVTVRFGEPVAFPLQAMIFVPIVCGKGLEERGSLARGTSGSGPYVLTEAVPDDHYSFALRKDYRGPTGETSETPGLPAKVVLKVITNTTTLANLLLNGQVDGGIVGGAEVERLQGAGVASVPLASGSLQTYFNEAAGHPTADPALRKAMAMAVDRAAVAQVGGGPLANSLAMDGANPCPDLAVDETLPAHDVDAAGAELDRAGWRTGDGGIRVKDGERLTVTALELEVGDPGRNAASELIKSAWTDLGIDVKTKSLGATATTEALEQGTWDVTPVLSIDVLVPSQLMPFVSGPAPPKGLNQGSVHNADYDRLAAMAMRAPESEVCALWNEAEEALLARADVVPLYRTEALGWHTKRTKFRYDAIDILPMSIRMYQGS